VLLLDTDVLVYAINESAPEHEASLQVLEAALNHAIPAFLVPQVLLECYSVAISTRAQLALEPRDLLAEMRQWRSAIPLLEVKSEVMDELDRLGGVAVRRGGAIYDLFLVAQMRTHGIGEICTFNVRDFRLPGIQAYLPEEVLARYRR
jgi:predicted nucleic acid-binding protein